MAESLKELQSYQDLQSVRRGLWWWILFLWVYWLVWTWLSLTLNPLQYTYLLSLPSPGTLISEWWSRDHFFFLFLMLFSAVPLTVGFVTDSSLVSSRRVFHLVVVFLAFLLSVVMLFFWSIDYNNANAATTANAYNRFNDPRWCCVNFALAPERCNPVAALNTCPLGLGQGDLRVSLSMLLTFWFLPPWILILIVDFFVLIKGVFERALRRYMRQSGYLTDANGEAAEDDDEDDAGGALDVEAQRPPPALRVKGGAECPLPAKEQLRVAVARQQQIAAALANKYKGKNSRR